jgi:hypothetical protein
VSLGLADSLIGAGSAFLAYLLGKQADKTDRLQILRMGGIVMVSLWLGRYIASTPLAIFVLSTFVGFGQWLIMVPFYAIFYDFGRDSNTAEFFMFREYPVVISRAIVYGIGIAVVGSGIKSLFWMGVVAYGLFIFLPRLRLSRGNPNVA